MDVLSLSIVNPLMDGPWIGGATTDVKSRLAFTRPRCLAAYLELASVDFATVEVEFELNRSRVGRKQQRQL